MVMTLMNLLIARGDWMGVALLARTLREKSIADLSEVFDATGITQSFALNPDWYLSSQDILLSDSAMNELIRILEAAIKNIQSAADIEKPTYSPVLIQETITNLLEVLKGDLAGVGVFDQVIRALEVRFAGISTLMGTSGGVMYESPDVIDQLMAEQQTIIESLVQGYADARIAATIYSQLVDGFKDPEMAVSAEVSEAAKDRMATFLASAYENFAQAYRQSGGKEEVAAMAGIAGALSADRIRAALDSQIPGFFSDRQAAQLRKLNEDLIAQLEQAREDADKPLAVKFVGVDAQVALFGSELSEQDAKKYLDILAKNPRLFDNIQAIIFDQLRIMMTDGIMISEFLVDETTDFGRALMNPDSAQRQLLEALYGKDIKVVARSSFGSERVEGDVLGAVVMPGASWSPAAGRAFEATSGSVLGLDAETGAWDSVRPAILEAIRAGLEGTRDANNYETIFSQSAGTIEDLNLGTAQQVEFEAAPASSIAGLKA